MRTLLKTIKPKGITLTQFFRFCAVVSRKYTKDHEWLSLENDIVISHE